LHPDQQCAQAAVRRRTFARALRITGSPDTSAVIEHVENLVNEASALATTAQREQVAQNMSTP